MTTTPCAMCNGEGHHRQVIAPDRPPEVLVCQGCAGAGHVVVCSIDSISDAVESTVTAFAALREADTAEKITVQSDRLFACLRQLEAVWNGEIE